MCIRDRPCRGPRCGGASTSRAGPVREVRRLRHREAERGPAFVGGDVVGRVGPAGFRRVLSDADPALTGPEVAPGVPGLRACDETAERDPRPPRRGTGSLATV